MILIGDVIEQLKTLPDESVHTVVTSPPYWQLRDYKVDGQIGQEPTLDEHINKMVEVFKEVKRVLRQDGTLWLNIGDAYGSSGYKAHNTNTDVKGWDSEKRAQSVGKTIGGDIKAKDLIGLPWRIAFALQADGWYLRSDIIWSKPNPMPSSVKDRPTSAREYIFLLTKKPQYYYDAEAIKIKAQPHKKPGKNNAVDNPRTPDPKRKQDALGKQTYTTFNDRYTPVETVNRRTVWEIATQGCSEAHFATFPEMIPKLCILAGSSAKGCCSECGAPYIRNTETKFTQQSDVSQDRGKRDAEGNKSMIHRNDGDLPRGTNTTLTTGWAPSCECDVGIVPCTVLDPFLGSGTTGRVAQNEGRDWIGIELNPEYAELAKKRTAHLQRSLDLG